MAAKENDTVKVHYTGTLDDGSIFDSSEERTPLEFTIGEGSLIPAFENAVVGMSPGDSKTVKVNAEDAYGPFFSEMIVEIDRKEFPDGIDLNPGVDLRIEDEEGWARTARIVEVNEDKVTIDANHPLAGKDLTFKIKLMDIVNGHHGTA